MTAWGTFETDGQIHVAPCDRMGWLLEPHVKNENCVCEPTVDVDSITDSRYPRALWVHKDLPVLQPKGKSKPQSSLASWMSS